MVFSLVRSSSLTHVLITSALNRHVSFATPLLLFFFTLFFLNNRVLSCCLVSLLFFLLFYRFYVYIIFYRIKEPPFLYTLNDLW